MTTFHWQELWSQGAHSPEWSHSGIAVLSDGTVIFAAPWGRDLVVMRDPDSVEYVSTPLLELHGITVAISPPFESLWLADPGVKPRSGRQYASEIDRGRAGRFNLVSRTFQELEEPRHPTHAEQTWRPTSVIDVPDGVWVADGYGASLVHRFDLDGSYLGSVSSAEGLRLDCPHGLVLDTRSDEPTVLIADRRNRRIVRVDLDGEVCESILSSSILSPSSLAIRGADVVVTELDGALLAISRSNVVRELVSRTERAEKDDSWPARDGWPNLASASGPVRPPLREGELNSPHGLAVGPDGDIYLTEWVIGGRQLRLHRTDNPQHLDQFEGIR